MNKPAFLLSAMILASGCSGAPAKSPAPANAPAAMPTAHRSTPKPSAAFIEPQYDYIDRIRLSGNILSAPQLKVMGLAVVPFGTEANAIGMEKQKGGVQFQIALESCSENGCIVESGDVTKIIVARSGIADAFPLAFIEPGWRRQGLSAISDRGWLAVPVSTLDNTREIWIIDDRFRLRKRISHKITNPSLFRWRGEDLFMVFQGPDEKMLAKRVDIDAGRLVSASPIEPWWPSCPGQSASQYSAGWEGENPLGFGGRLVMPVWRRGESRPTGLELPESIRPMTSQGLASPVKIAFDCDGRICIISALGEDIWCQRFSPEGKLLAASPITGSIAGDAKGIQIDRRGRFFYLETILNSAEPEKIHLIRLE